MNKIAIEQDFCELYKKAVTHEDAETRVNAKCLLEGLLMVRKWKFQAQIQGLDTRSFSVFEDGLMGQLTKLVKE